MVLRSTKVGVGGGMSCVMLNRSMVRLLEGDWEMLLEGDWEMLR